MSIDPSVGRDVVKEVLTGGADSIFPIRVVISFLDGYHDLTGLPWWIIISSTTVALRIALFPLLIMQLKKLKKIGDLLHKFSMFSLVDDNYSEDVIGSSPWV